MFSNTGTRLIFLFLLGLSAIFAPTVPAQSAGELQLSAAESPAETSGVFQSKNGGRDEKNLFYSKSAAEDAGAAESKIPIRDFGGEKFAGPVDLTVSIAADTKIPSFRFASKDAAKRRLSGAVRRDDPDDDTAIASTEKFQWGAALRQSLMVLGVQHGYALAFQKKTRQALKGKFFKDYADSVNSLSGWDDGGRFFTNYIAHPMQGSLTGFIYLQNKPTERKLEFGASADYWRSRMIAMAWSAAWSTQFELGPISQASIGNIGLNGKQAWVDIVVTPTVGTALLVTEDAIDRFIIRRIERAGANLYVRALTRMFLNPTRTLANLFRFKEPWYRDRAHDR